MIKIIEVKARSTRLNEIRDYLHRQNAIFKGLDHQIDTYFEVQHGRLKLRQGNIENNLIHYHRNNHEGPKLSQVTLFKSNPESTLKKILIESMGVLSVVDKNREIYFIDNVKFHLDNVKELGTFVEIEAIDEIGQRTKDQLNQQCQFYIKELRIAHKDLISMSYSDLINNIRLKPRNDCYN